MFYSFLARLGSHVSASSSIFLPSRVVRERFLPGTHYHRHLVCLLQRRDKNVTLIMSFPMEEGESSVAWVRHLVSVSALWSGHSADARPDSLTSHWCISGYILYSRCRLAFQF